MSLTYPVTPPTTIPSYIQLRPRSTTGVSVSPFTAQHQVYSYPAQVWQMDVRLPPMKRDEAAPWIGFLQSLHGRFGTFTMGDVTARVPQGTAPGTPVVYTSSQTGMDLLTEGWTVSQTGVLLAGDYFQFGTELHMVTEDADSDVNGRSRLEIWPAIRNSPTHGTSITTSNTEGLWRLTSDEQAWTPGNPFYSISFSCIEAV